MRVTTVQVERRKSDNSYGNRMVMLSAELDEADDVAAVVDDLAALAIGRASPMRIARAEQADAHKAAVLRQKELAEYQLQQEVVERSYRERVPAEAVTGEDLAADEDDADELGSVKRGEPVRWRPGD